MHHDVRNLLEMCYTQTCVYYR